MNKGEIRVEGVRRPTADATQLAEAVLAILRAQSKRNEPEWSDTKTKPTKEAM